LGIVTDAHRTLTNALIGLPVSRLLEDINFRSIVFPSTLLDIPSQAWCLVLTSEGEPTDLTAQVGNVIAGHQDQDPRFSALLTTPVELEARLAVSSVENWVLAVQALATADYMVADVTGFQPTVMLMLGVRSVLRRGVTISVTNENLQADGYEIPFNVQETRVLSFAEEPFYDDLYRAMSEGRSYVEQDPEYLDLPAFHGVRVPRPETWAEDDQRRVLVLCPFKEEYQTYYRLKLRSIIRGHTHDSVPVRMLDLKSPRLVGQALYEQIRWSSRCLVDWTHWRPNVFFELGVRLACSEFDPLCIIRQAEETSVE